MRPSILILCLGLAFGAGEAFAADQPLYGPPPGWVHPTPRADPEAKAGGNVGSVQVLTSDQQANYGPDGDEFYSAVAVKLRTPEALSSGNLVQGWNPETETLTIHWLRVVRGASVIDLLADGKKFTVLRREKNLEAAALDGALTATFQPEDLRIGDVLDYAYTLKRKDPLRGGFSEGVASVAGGGVVGYLRIREIWPDAKPIRWRTTEGLEGLKTLKEKSGTEILFEAKDFEGVRPPEGAPLRYRRVGQLYVSQFADWAQVSSLMAPLYKKASTLAADSPLRAEAAKIKAASTDPRARALAALKLVEEQTRYVFLGMNLGGYLPADADLTWSRRFGDCKGKTALLLAILRELDIEAEPVFVNASAGDGLDRVLPMLTLFDHVLVRARIGGKAYWLDGTRLGDRSIEDIPDPGFRWGLPIRERGATLEPIDQKPYAKPSGESVMTIDATAGIDAPAKVHAEYVARYDVGQSLRLLFEQMGKADLDRSLREYWSERYEWITATAVGAGVDPATGDYRVWLDGAGKMNWYANGAAREFSIDDSGLGGDVNIQRQPGPNSDAPFAVDFPSYVRTVFTMRLPNNGAGFRMIGGRDVDATIGGVAMKRVVRLEGGAASVTTEERSVQREFPFAEAAKAQADLRALGGFLVAVQSVKAPAPTLNGPGPPKDAAGFAARAAGERLAQDYEKAIADFSEAIRLDPKSVKYVYDRATVYFELGEDDKAMADFDRALKLAPKDAMALMGRAELALYMKRDAQAKRDFERALELSPSNAGFYQRRAEAYEAAAHFTEAASFYDDWLKRFPKDGAADYIRALHCRVRAADQAQKPEAALAECEALIKGDPSPSSTVMGGVGLAMLRLKRYDEAIAAFDKGLASKRTAAELTYGRGLAKLRKGQTADGKADLAAALAAEPSVAATYEGYGFAP